jgi:RimJ/RimL family protein N-acetyltransferase
MRLETRRFVLRDFEESDYPTFRRYHQDSRYLAFYGPEPREPEHAETLLRSFAAWAAEKPRRNYQLAIVSRAFAGALVGTCGLRMEGQAPGTAELGLELAAIHWGRYGYAIEIARALLGFAFEDLGLEEITGITSSANVPVRRLAQWFGAEQIEDRPGTAWMMAHGWSEQVWLITRETWERRL